MARIGSKKSLVAKLGIKEGQRIRIINAPSKYDMALGRLPKNVVEAGNGDSELDFIQLFTSSEDELRRSSPSSCAHEEGRDNLDSYPGPPRRSTPNLTGVTVARWAPGTAWPR
jgi:hypothetical protein